MACANLCSLVTTIEPEEKVRCCVRGSSGWIKGKSSSVGAGQALEWIPQSKGHGFDLPEYKMSSDKILTHMV